MAEAGIKRDAQGRFLPSSKKESHGTEGQKAIVKKTKRKTGGRKKVRKKGGVTKKLGAKKTGLKKAGFKKKGEMMGVMLAPSEPVDVLTRVRDVLLELMADSSSDAVRVAAAKALIDKILKNETEEEDEESVDAVRKARGAVWGEDQTMSAEEALREACALLDAIRAEKLDEVGA